MDIRTIFNVGTQVGQMYQRHVCTMKVTLSNNLLFFSILTSIVHLKFWHVTFCSRSDGLDQVIYKLTNMFRLLTRTRLPGRVVPAGVGPVKFAVAKHFYSTQKRKVVRPENAPRIRYLVMMVALSFGFLHFVTTKVDKKAPKVSFSEREFQQYERETGLKRRHKLISHEKNDQYAFYVVPYCHDVKKAEKELSAKLPKDRQVKIVEPTELIKREIEDEKKYCYLLQDLQALSRPMPRGLITALIKEEVELFMNTTKGQFDTNIVVLNYPQSTEEAIKFENDISDVRTCIKLEDDYARNLKSDLSDDDVRKVNNVFGYFDTVDKVTTVNSKVKVLE